MLILLLMALGMVIGWRRLPEKLRIVNGWLQYVCIAVLIFAMGVRLGNDPAFFENLLSLGGKSLLFAVLPIAGSVVLVWLLCRKTLCGKGEEEKSDDMAGHH